MESNPADYLQWLPIKKKRLETSRAFPWYDTFNLLDFNHLSDTPGVHNGGVVSVVAVVFTSVLRCYSSLLPLFILLFRVGDFGFVRRILEKTFGARLDLHDSYRVRVLKILIARQGHDSCVLAVRVSAVVA